MNLIVTCRCGHKFRVALLEQSTSVPCPECGKMLRVKQPATARPAPPPPEDDDLVSPDEDLDELVSPDGEGDDEVKLQDLPAGVAPQGEILADLNAPATQAHAPRAIPDDEDEGGSYGLDADDGLTHLDTGTGVYGTFAVFDLPDRADCIAYGCGGDWALAGQGDDVLILNMKKKKKAGFYEDHAAEVTAVALSASEPLALSGDDDGELRLWDVVTGKRLKKITAHEDCINSVALSPNGAFAVSGSDDGRTRLWNLTTGKRRKLEYSDWLDDHDETVTFVTFSRDGAKILAGGSEGRIAMWDVETGDRIKKYPGLELPISCVRLSDEGGKVTATTRPIQSGGLNYLVIHHWNSKSGKPIDRFNLAVESASACISPDRGGQRVILGGGGDIPWLGVWSLERGQCRHIYDRVEGAPICLAVSPTNNRVMAALHNYRLQLFGLEPF